MDTWYGPESPGKLLELIHNTEGRYYAYLPASLPPQIQITNVMAKRLARAEHGLGRLSELGRQLPNPELLTAAFLRREAVLSSQIEGVNTTVDKVYEYEVDLAPQDSGAAREAYNNFVALRYGLDQIAHRGITIGLIRELHERLMDGIRDARGGNKNPGALRSKQNYIGKPGSRLAQALYIPPPPDHVAPLLQDWEKFVQSKQDLPDLAKIAFAHYQFEAIHPFEDGNGRVGRLIISLSLQRDGLLTFPILSLSGYLFEHRDQYYAGLRGVTRDGNWQGWLDYLLEGFARATEDAIQRSQAILSLQEEFRNQVKEATRSARIRDVLDFIFLSPVFSPIAVAKHLGLTSGAIPVHLRQLERLGLVEETTDKYNNQIYKVPRLLALLR